MDDLHDGLKTPSPKGCLGSVAGFFVLAVISPFAALVHSWRRWTRGEGARVEVELEDWPGSHGGASERIDVTIDVPVSDSPETRRRVTDAVIRIAEALRQPDDVFNLIYRLPSGEEAVVLPVGPQLQELGERFFLTLNQGALAGRTVVWLTLGRGTALATVVDPFTVDPGGENEPEGLLGTPAARWSMASEWAVVGPSMVVRLVLVVPVEAGKRVVGILSALDGPATSAGGESSAS